jgi:hypothetical protein
MRKINKALKIGLILGLIILASRCLIYIPYEERWPGERRSYPPREETQPGTQIDISFVYSYLSPYGYWVYLSPYGHVWIPRYVPYGWRPYTRGRWVWTDVGWLWLSNFDWGWLVFHYGRWGWHQRLGWFWVPGTIWAPAWVIWTWGDFYIGWAPIPPDIDWVPGVGLAAMRVEPVWQAWVFVENRYFLTPYLERYVLPPERNRTILNFTVSKRSLAPRGNTIFNEGVDPQLVSRWTRTEIRKYELQEASRPGRESLTVNSVVVPRLSISRNEVAKPSRVYEPEMVEQELNKERPRMIRLDQLQVERERLERSQREEEALLRRKMEEERQQARDEATRQEILRRYQLQLEQLRKQHQEEKKELDQRHEQEKKKISGQPVRKKEK